MVHGEVKRGTKVICYLKEDQSDILEERRLKDVVKQNSEFIVFPIELHVDKSKEQEVTAPEGAEEERWNRLQNLVGHVYCLGPT